MYDHQGSFPKYSGFPVSLLEAIVERSSALKHVADLLLGLDDHTFTRFAGECGAMGLDLDKTEIRELSGGE